MHLSREKQSAGILVFRNSTGPMEICLGHPGGPFYSKKDNGCWTIFKGEFAQGDHKLAAAKREFLEETGFEITGEFLPLAPIRLKSGKTVYTWAVEMDFPAERIKSNKFEIEWPPRSGQLKSFPEIDKAGWFDLSTAMEKIHPSQIPLLEELAARIK